MEHARLIFAHYKMYILLLLLALVIPTQQQVKDPAFLQKLKTTHEECAKETGADLAAITKAWDENRFPNDEKFKCYYKCVTMKFGIVDATGEVVDEKLREAAAQMNDAKQTDEIVEECGPLKGADLCETAYKLIACIKAAKLD